MSLKVLYGNVLVKPIIEEEDADEIVASHKAPEDLIRGEVKEIGNGEVLPNNVRGPMEVMPGNIVWFETKSAKVFPVNDEDWYLLNQRNIFVVEGAK